MSKPQTSAVVPKGGNTKLHNSLVYIRQHWQLYAFFIMPAFVLTIVFRYIPMGGIAIAFMDYNPFAGIFGSEFVGMYHFERFLTSPHSEQEQKAKDPAGAVYAQLHLCHRAVRYCADSSVPHGHDQHAFGYQL